MEWNAENQLTRVTKNSVEQARFKYDPLGRRVEKVAAGVTTSYTYHNEDILREANGSTALMYVHGQGIDEPLASDDGSALVYYQTDGLGSLIKATSSTGSVTLTRQYDAWGNIEAGGTSPAYAFTGRDRDSETGLVHYRSRYYSPDRGRFISDDPIRFRGGVNFYVYVSNRPADMIDPLGLDSFICKRPAMGPPQDGGDTRNGPDVWGNPFYHNYICVVRPDGTSNCGGKRAMRFPMPPDFTVPGGPSNDNDKYVPGRCTPLTKEPGSCFERCLERRIDRGNSRGVYRLFGANCNDWVNDQYWGCVLECFMPGMSEG